jgi:Transglycosylase-like domain
MKRIFTPFVAIGLMVGVWWMAAEIVVSAPNPHPPHLVGSSPTVVTTIPPTTTTTPPTTTTTLPADYAEWSRVASCESGGWVVLGSAYPDSLGITAQNWANYGGTGDTSPAAQIAVADRMIASLGIGIPDQGECAAW